MGHELDRDANATASASASASSSSKRPQSSSAAFLHHLHTDPSSHHITLSANHNGAGPSSSPRSISVPLEPTVSQTNRPTGVPHRSPTKSTTFPLSPTSQSSAGPSSLLSRNPSQKRARPKTAPGRKEDYPTSPPIPMDSTPISPMDQGGLNSEELTQIASSGDSCIATFAQEEAGLANAVDMLSVSGGDEKEGKTFLLGRAGSLASGTSDPSKYTTKTPSVSTMDWTTFSHAYAHGLFDPNKIPNPPQSSGDSPTEVHSAHSSPGKRYASTLPLHLGDNTSSSEGYSSKRSGGSTMTSVSSAPSTSAGSLRPGSMAAAMAARKKAYELEHLPDRPPDQILRPDKLALPSYSLAAATVRMASSGLRESDFAPLAMPSPERELLDPMASVVSVDSNGSMKDSASSDPGSSRFPLHRSMSSAVTSNTFGNLRLPTIQASPVSTPSEPHGKGKAKVPEPEISPHKVRLGVVNSRIPPASAPLEKRGGADPEAPTDYFGSASPQAAAGSSSSSSTADDPTPKIITTGTRTPDILIRSTPPRPSADQIPSMALPQDMGPLYDRLGWLPAPLPPDETARRRALYRFNILHTAADLNFDRIAHMAKLVFNPKIVLIALIDSETQWHKTQSGLGAEEAARISSFCSHSVLARSDEPFVVLDTKLDWRFEKNPQVIGAPHIRFYAGAPLRTMDGHNIGSLCIIDDKPRAEFPPRSRLILKEFAAVAMREMELWRDKLQLRVRDKIQTSMEKFTRECLEMDADSSASNAEAAAKMDQVYSRAGQLVCSTLDLDGSFILDISQIEMVHVDTPTGKKTVYRADPYSTAEHHSPVLERSETFGPVNAFPVLATTPTSTPSRPLSSHDHEKFSEFLRDHRDGKIFESIAPVWIRYMFPQKFRYGMVVPIYGVDQQPFALICAYTTNKAKQFLEGYELQFLRAIGVIILSAVLRRRMVLADKTKSILISSVSHELRTPLHGILAAAELLSDTSLDTNQLAFLKTVQTCGNSLIETVNHVLDFTKLSGSGSGKTSSGKLGKVNLGALVEQTVEGCWIGQRARFFMGDADIGSFYAPPTSSGLVPKSQRAQVGEKLAHVETVIDIDQREKGWMVRCEKGGLRRVLMNLVGNSFKFTTDGYVQITLREMPHPPGSRTIPVEMAVIDTGKGIGKDFLKDQLFHPFSQENPLQTGTGLGLAIVNSIVRSENVNGKVDVWSSEGMGTEIKVSFEVEVEDDDDDTSSNSSHVSSTTTVNTAMSFGQGLNISFLAFQPEHRGHRLSLEVLSMYANAWQFGVLEGKPLESDIILINEDEGLLHEYATKSNKPILFAMAVRGMEINQYCESIRKNGGFCQVLFKPIGPTSLYNGLQKAIEWLHHESPGQYQVNIDDEQDDIHSRPSISRGSSGASAESNSTISELSSVRFAQPLRDHRLPLQRRRSEENEQVQQVIRPSLGPRGMTYHAPRRVASGSVASDDTAQSSPQQGSASPTSTISTISLADGGVMLKAATVPTETPRKGRSARVMVVEDNVINRRVLGAFLKKRGFEYAEAVDGRAGVELFESTPQNYWDVILMDISMPVMNGHDATRAIRKIEATRRDAPQDIPFVPPPGRPVSIPPIKVVQARAKIFALTGLATQDDKREAFGSGVDG
uniref:histidine kinase n=1 Tax=Kwoniella bestiolae CBS 10118 TaxID=1296100 RepID=A0A1B9G2V4_9TREE|nr:two-component system sensor protein [Kwoniella bestiolae CBS 10118]OCF25349.1 two-component system sensor protein [Kwoniella bestiolae CBS 10118]